MLNIADDLVMLLMAVIFQYVLLVKRFSRKKTLVIMIAGVSVVFMLNIFPILTNYNLFRRLYPFTVNLPVFLIFIYLYKHRGFRVLFNLLTTVFLCYLSSISGYFFAIAFGRSMIYLIAGRMLSFPLLLLFVLKVFRPLYMMMLDNMKTGWGLLCVIPILSCSLMYTLFYYSINVRELPKIIIPICITVAFTLIIYGVICVFFRQMQEKFAMENEQQLLKIQVTALQNQADAVLEMNEKTRILRHDARHYLHNFEALLKSGKTETAQNFIDRFEDMLEQSAIPKYCENHTINAILAYYLENAKNEGIDIDTRLDIPENLPIDEMELSTVLANAIENARHACAKMPRNAKKTLEILSVSSPHFVFEITNSYCGEVLFDKNGLPLSEKAEHGIGTQSIDAFVKKYNAILDYQAENDIFRLRMLLPQYSAEQQYG
jgi:signal transduction histidine kinase